MLKEKLLSTGTVEYFFKQLATVFASKKELKAGLDAKAEKVHGNHVPGKETANNKRFLRNDGNWADVTPGNIGALQLKPSYIFNAEGAEAYAKILTCTVTGTYSNMSEVFAMAGRGRTALITITTNGSGNDKKIGNIELKCTPLDVGGKFYTGVKLVAGISSFDELTDKVEIWAKLPAWEDLRIFPISNYGRNYKIEYNSRTLQDTLPVFTKTIESIELDHVSEKTKEFWNGKAPGGFGLGGFCKSITDWSTVTKTGWYMGLNAKNSPTNNKWFMGEVIAHNDIYVYQRVTDFSQSGTWYHRFNKNGNWSSWTVMKFTDTVYVHPNDTNTRHVTDAEKTKWNNKVDAVEGKGLSTNDFTDKYKNVYEYCQPVPEEGLLALTLRGPDNAIYRLRLNDQMGLEIEPFVNSRKVNYMISGNSYYSLNETAEGHIQLVESATLPEGATAGRIRAIDNSDYIKYELVIENGSVSFKTVTESIVDEAGYLTTNTNGEEKVYCFKIEKGAVYAECITIHSNELSVVQLNNK